MLGSITTILRYFGDFFQLNPHHILRLLSCACFMAKVLSGNDVPVSISGRLCSWLFLFYFILIFVSLPVGATPHFRHYSTKYSAPSHLTTPRVLYGTNIGFGCQGV